MFKLVAAFTTVCLTGALMLRAEAANASTQIANQQICNEYHTVCFKDEGMNAQVDGAEGYFSDWATTGHSETYGNTTYYQWEDGSGRCLKWDSPSDVVTTTCNQNEDSQFWAWDSYGGWLENLYGLEYTGVPVCAFDNGGPIYGSQCSIYGVYWYLESDETS